MQTEKKKVIYRIIVVLTVLLSLGAAISKIFIGFDIDEGYAIALPYRFLQEDKLFLDMWEVHQTSAVFAALILWPYLKLTGGVEGLVLYVRIICMLLHLVISIVLYHTLSKKIDKKQGFLLAAIYFNFLPKWMISVDFSMQFIWFFTINMLCFIKSDDCVRNKENKKACIYMLLNGLSLALLVLGYPTMLFLYPVFLIFILINKKWEKADKRRMASCLTAGCVVPAILFLGYLFSYMTPVQLIENIPNVFSDGSHQFDGAAKWSLWVAHMKDVIVQTLITLLPAVAVAGIYRWILKKVGKKDEVSFTTNLTAFYIIITAAAVLFANVLGIAWGPFRLQIRYIIIFVLGFVLMKKEHKDSENKWIKWLLLFSTLASFLAILLASNVGTTSSSSYLIIGVMMTLYLLMHAATDKQLQGSNENRYEDKNRNVSDKNRDDKNITCKRNMTKITGTLLNASVIIFLISVIMCKGYYVRVSEYPPSNILEERVQLNDGPAKGIYVYPSEHEVMQETWEIISENTTKDDRLLYLGTQALSNLYTEGKMVLPTTISTPAFNEQWVHYFTLHQDKKPTVIVLSKATIDNREKFFELNPFGQWIRDNYDVENRQDTKHLCVIR